MYYYFLKWLRTSYFPVSEPNLSQFWSKTAFQLVCHLPTDGRTDIPSCRDARTHLKRNTIFAQNDPKQQSQSTILIGSISQRSNNGFPMSIANAIWNTQAEAVKMGVGLLIQNMYFFTNSEQSFSLTWFYFWHLTLLQGFSLSRRARHPCSYATQITGHRVPPEEILWLWEEIRKLLRWAENHGIMDHGIMARWAEWFRNRLIEYWATRLSVRLFARTAHSFACSGLLALLAPSAALTRLLSRSLRSQPRSWEGE